MKPTPPEFVEVAVAAPLDQSLTYRVPDGVNLCLGQRVLVPLGRRLVTGYVLSFPDEPQTEHRLKKVREALDESPIFPENMIPFFRWIARYYQFPIGEVIKGALPAGLTSQSGRKVLLTETGRDHFANEFSAEETYPWLATLIKKGHLSISATKKLWQGPEQKLLLQWQKKGFIIVEQVIAGESVRAKSEVCVRLQSDWQEKHLKHSLKITEQKTLDLILSCGGSPEHTIPRRDLNKQYSGVRTGLSGLTEKEIVSLEKQHIYRDPFGETPHFFDRPEQLSGDQKKALAALCPAVTQEKFAPFLLHGVTGSGKTEVYLGATQAALDAGKDVLVLVPEIALATQLEGHFLSRFGDEVALLHSGLSKGERFDQWQRVLKGQARIVIGARSAIFAPLQSPGLLIVDEEHDPAYKQEDTLRYQARDLAVLRARQCEATVVLGSATPAITSYTHSQNKKYQLITLPKRIEDRPLPEVEVVDLTEVKTVSGRPPLFSPQLTQSIRNTLAQGEQALIFLNRRGFANCMLCGDCGKTVQCTNCHITLTLHKKKEELACHYCGYTASSATVCSHCRSTNLVGIGFGTERLEEEIASLFPKARVARLDRDTTVKRKDFLSILRAVHSREVDILIGTQMITKGHHFPSVTLVGVVWADAGLGIPDFKAGERTFQLLSQVTGRAGRGEKPGRVIIQTHQPEHYSVLTAQSHDYNAMYEQEISLRKALSYPPFSRLINLRFEGESEDRVQTGATNVAHRAMALSKKAQTTVLGPSPSPLARLRGRFRWQVLLKGSNIDQLHHISHLLSQDKTLLPPGVKMSVDVDPENML